MALSSHPEPVWSPVRLDRAESCVLRASSNGQTYRVSLSIPTTPAPESGYPLLLVMDGPALFATVAENERRLSHRSEVTGVAPTIIVGVGHDGETLHHPPQRRRDYTPCPPEAGAEQGEGATGGAGPFLQFLLEQVLPLIEARAPVDPTRKGLLGHSLAGGFVLEALAQRPDAFSTFACISPSIWWAPERLRRQIAEAGGVDALSLMLAVGEREQPVDDSRRARRRMVDEVRDVAQRLSEARPTARVELFVLPDEDHASVVSPASVRALRLLSGLPRV